MTFTNPKLSSRDRNFIIVGVVAFVAIVFFFTQYVNKKLEVQPSTVTINGIVVTAELATTPSQQLQGLSGRKKLCETCGMLFVFNNKDVRTFVMRDMLIPLDIIFLDGDKIVKIAPNLIPEGPNPSSKYSSDVPANYVLEVNSGFADKFNVNLGDKVKYEFKN